MISSFWTTLILSSVSAVLAGLGCLVKRLRPVCAVLGLVWLAAALPVMFFLNLSARHVLLFYVLSAACGLAFQRGRRVP